jgi:hypothetical protein
MKHPLGFGLLILGTLGLPIHAQWTMVGGNAQHTNLQAIAAQPLNRIKWSTPVDQLIAGEIAAGTFSGDIYEHFGPPIITAANTVFVPIRVTTNVYAVEVHNGSTGAVKRTLTTDWIPPASEWLPSFAPALSSRNRFYFPGAGGTLYYLDSPDTNSGPPTQIAFYGIGAYQANPSAFNAAVTISTPIVGDRYGDIFFGFTVSGSNPAGLQSGIARISATGVGTWVTAVAAAGGDTSTNQIPVNAAPTLSNDHQTLYFGVSGGGTTPGYLASVNATTLAPINRVRLKDPASGLDALLLDISSAIPVVGTDGDVYYGVFEYTCCSNNDRGWLLHFDSTLSVVKTPGAFGWDDTPSIVPRALVPQYQGTSQYLIFTKYNNYKDTGTGNGLNRIAVLDPNASMADPVTGATVMQEVITILGQTPDPPPAGAVREWCINSAAIDKVNKSAIANSEDGVLYRWDFTSNSFTQQIRLTPGVGEAYTPTVIGPDGTVYAINDSVLFAVGQ